MLPTIHRLTDAPDFRETTRHGRRGGSRTLVVHLLQNPGASGCEPALVGFVAGRPVGGAVVRNRVRRQLRHLMASRLVDLEPGSRVVVRVLPAAASVTGADLRRDLDTCLRRCLGAMPSGAGPTP